MVRAADRRRLTARVAILAFLVGLLAPWVQAVPASTPGQALLEVCSVKVPGGAGSPDRPGAPAGGIDHLHPCPCCVLHAGLAGPPPAGLRVLASGPVHLPSGAVSPAPARLARAWQHAAPRGPPSLRA